MMQKTQIQCVAQDGSIKERLVVEMFPTCPRLMPCGHTCACDPARVAGEAPPKWDSIHLYRQHHCAQGHLLYRFRPELKPW